MKLPREYQEPAAYFLACLCIWALTNSTLDVAWVRHRWRQTVLASKVIGMVSTILCLLWPSQLCIYGLCLCLFNGFADPRLHLASIRRNPARPFTKWYFCITLLLHHAGGAFVVCDMLRPVALENRSFADLELPIMVSCLSELFSWFTDLKVLMRTAPKWFTCAHQVAVLLQLGACTVLFMYFPHVLCPVTIIGTMVGSASWLVAGFIGFKNSTWEILPDVDLKASVARVYHKECPLTSDSTVLPFCQKDYLVTPDNMTNDQA